MQHMKVVAKTKDRNVSVVGCPNSGWRVVDAGVPGSVSIPFRIYVIDDGSGGVNLCYESIDGKYKADSNHASLSGAVETAQEIFGIAQSQWSK